jgi:hypothetical protein
LKCLVDKDQLMPVSEPYFPSLVVDGEEYEFPHLEPFQIVVPSERARRDLQVDIRFTNHCFSRKLAQGEDPDHPDVFFDHNRQPRVLCPDRYRLSHDLPEFLHRMNHPAVKVYQTKTRRNWTYVLEIEDPALPYYIFFALRRAPRSDVDDLKLTVESAYPDSEDFDSPHLLGRMGFQLLCGKTYLGEPVATKR